VALVFAAAAVGQVVPGNPLNKLPNMPPEIEALFKANDFEINGKSRCEVIDWVVSPDSGMPDDALRLARRYIGLCVLPHDDVTPAFAARRLGAETFRFDIDGGVITLLVKSQQETLTSCCGPLMELTRLGDSDYWAARRRIADADTAMISLVVIEPGRPIRPEDWRTFRGPSAPAKPAEVELGKWRGKLLQPELQSVALGETRALAVYLPPGYTKDREWPALFMSDAGAIEFGGLVESMIEAGEIRPIVIVSAQSGEEAIVGTPPPAGIDDLRSAEYLRNWPGQGDRFEKHMQFFSKELVDYAIAEYGVSPDRRDHAVGGKSSGGVFSMWAGVMHPETFAIAIPMSPGWLTLRQENLSSGPRARFFISGGKYEPAFLETARLAESVLTTAGYDVAGRYYAAGHFHDQWAVALRAALIDSFPPN